MTFKKPEFLVTWCVTTLVVFGMGLRDYYRVVGAPEPGEIYGWKPVIGLLAFWLFPSVVAFLVGLHVERTKTTP